MADTLVLLDTLIADVATGYVSARTPALSTPTTGGDFFQQSLDDAYQSALTKFDALEALFDAGLKVPRVCEMIRTEMQPDLAGIADEAQRIGIDRFLAKTVGTTFSAWKKHGGVGAVHCKQIKDVPLPWSSIEAYPEFVASLILNYCSVDAEDEARTRAALEQTLLETPLHATAVKLDGTCFGKMDTCLVGRKQVLGPQCESYQQTSTATASLATCDVGALRGAIASLLGVDLPTDSVCAWGELMCNPGYYEYQRRRLAGQWVCFGVVAMLPEPADSAELHRWSERLSELGFAHRLSGHGRLRLLLCPELRRLLREVGRCELVAEDVLPVGVTHAEMVARAAAGLEAGENEGLVLVSRSVHDAGQASLRKWKNSAEGSSVSLKHAQLLRSLDARRLADEGRLDARIADMVETMIRVTEAKTVVRKVGRRRSAE
jgi:hypothetical protein